MEGMEENGMATEPAHGLTGNLLREVLRTGPLKEIILLQMKGIDPDNASKLVETMLWEDPAVSLSLIGSAPGMVNWLLEFLLELGRQLDGLPGPLLGDILGKTGEEIDRERLKELREVYARLIRRLVLKDEASGELDAESLGRLLNRLLVLNNEKRLQRRSTSGQKYRAVLSQVDGREAVAAVGGLLRSAAGMAWSILTWSVRSLAAGRRPKDICQDYEKELTGHSLISRSEVFIT